MESLLQKGRASRQSSSPVSKERARRNCAGLWSRVLQSYRLAHHRLIPEKASRSDVIRRLCRDMPYEDTVCDSKLEKYSAV